MAIEAEALRDALRLALKFVDRAGGEGLGFVADAHNDYPETDAGDVCEAVAKTLGIEFGGPDYMALIGDGPLPDLIHRSALAEDTARAAEGTDERCEAALASKTRLEDAIVDALIHLQCASAWSASEAHNTINSVLTKLSAALSPALPLDKEAAR